MKNPALGEVWKCRNKTQTLKHDSPHDPLFSEPNGYLVFEGLSHKICARFQSGSDYPVAFTALEIL